MLNQKGVALVSILLWSAIILIGGLVTQDAVKRGYITIDLSNKEPLVQQANVVSATPIPSATFSPAQTSKPTFIPTPKPAYIPKPSPSPKSNINGSGVFNSINAYRTSKGLPGLDVSDELCRLATIRANFIAIDNHKRLKEEPGHPGFNEQLGFDKYSGRYIGENISFIGFNSTNNSSQGVVGWWETSPSHNELLLKTQVGDIAATKGCVATVLDQEGTVTILLVGDK